MVIAIGGYTGQLLLANWVKLSRFYGITKNGEVRLDHSSRIEILVFYN